MNLQIIELLKGVISEKGQECNQIAIYHTIKLYICWN